MEDFSYSREFAGEYESPFLSEVDSTGTARPTGNPEVPQLVGLLGELHDHELSEALFELATEFEDVAASRYASETGGYTLRSVHELRSYAATGFVYLGIGKKLYAFDAATGAKKWEYDTGRTIGQSSPCAVAKDGTVYYPGISGMVQ